MLTEKALYDPVLYNEWHVVAIADHIQTDRPIKVHLLGETLSLWRTNGKIVAGQDRCPHRGVSLSLGEIDEKGEIVCPYHAMSFNEAGQCTRIPADLRVTSFPKNASLLTYKTQVKYGFVWVSLGEPTQEVPIFPEWLQEDAITFGCGPYPITASAPRIVENFVDIAHFPFTHRDLLGDPEHPEVSDYTLSVSDEEISASDIHFYQPNPEGTGEAKSVSYLYRIVRPLSACFRKGKTEQFFSIFLAVTPIEETKSIAWLGVSRNYSAEVSNDELRKFQDDVMAQDVPMLESQSPQKLPLNLQQEFHFPCDKMSIAYRKWLKQLGLQFGTC